MQLNNWSMTIKCRSLQEQYNSDPELAFPNDEISQILIKIRNMWDLLPEDLEEVAEWSDTEITVTFEVLDNVYGFWDWLIMTCIPEHVELKKVM